MRRVLIAVACVAPVVGGCWASTTRVEPVSDEHVRFELGSPQPHLRKTEVAFREEPGALSLVVLRRDVCEVQEVRTSQDRIHTEVEASSRRWIPAAVLGGMALATVATYQRDDDERDVGPVIASSAVLLGAAAAFVMIPTLAERERTRLGELHTRTIPAPERPCGQAFVPHTRVTLRTTRGTRRGVTGPDGTVRFENLTKQQVRAVFVDGAVVDAAEP